MSLEPRTKRALEGALSELGVSKKEVEENPTKAGIRFVFGVPSKTERPEVER